LSLALSEEVKMRKNLPRILVAALILVFSLTPPIQSACNECKYSPNNFGFCRDNMSVFSGYLYCTEYVADQWTGRTDCTLESECTKRGDGGGGEGGDCWWTDIYGHCIFSF
jgi:hypothetical protein